MHSQCRDMWALVEHWFLKLPSALRIGDGWERRERLERAEQSLHLCLSGAIEALLLEQTEAEQRLVGVSRMLYIPLEHEQEAPQTPRIIPCPLQSAEQLERPAFIINALHSLGKWLVRREAE